VTDNYQQVKRIKWRW